MTEKIYDVAIIGSGPAGLTAAIYTTRGAASTIVLAGEKWGGQLMLTGVVENFPGFPDGIEGPVLMENMKKQVQGFGAEFVLSNAESIDVSGSPFKLTVDGKIVLSKSVIIATGAEAIWLGLPHEEDLIGRGISSCAPCDAPFFKDKKVAVVGGGDAAMEEALILTKYASEVTIIHRRDKFRASAVMQQKVLSNGNIKIIWNTEVTEIIGQEKLEKIILKNNQDNKTSELLIDGMFVAIGHKPQTMIFNGKIDLDEKGYIKRVPSDMYETSTSTPGIFVAGDVHDHHFRQAITASGFGCMAALEILRYIGG